MSSIRYFQCTFEESIILWYTVNNFEADLAYIHSIAEHDL